VSEIERWKTTTAYECPTCGALHASFDGECPLECGAELREVEVVAEHRLTDVRAENEQLRVLIGRAPHASHCEASVALFPGACSCWKKDVASVPELVPRARGRVVGDGGPCMSCGGNDGYGPPPHHTPDCYFASVEDAEAPPAPDLLPGPRDPMPAEPRTEDAARWIAREIIANEVKGFGPLPSGARPGICKALVKDAFLGWPDMAAAQATLDEWEWTDEPTVPELVERSRALGPVMEAQGDAVAQGLRDAADRMRDGER
jgi:hypothetical protein